MKNKWIRISICTFLLMFVSCDEPVTVVTNYIHRDGSITRVIEMRSSEDNFKLSEVQIPYDSTWNVKDSIEISDNDTVWVQRVEKTFRNADELNATYKQDSSKNGKFPRSVELIKRFHWFNTEFRFSEKLGSTMEFGYPVEDFFNDEELKYFFSPDYLSRSYADGPDSIKYRALIKAIDEKGEVWMIKSALSEWIGQFGKLTSGRIPEKLQNDLRGRESQIYSMITEKYSDNSDSLWNAGDFDSLWNAGVIQGEVLGKEYAEKFRNEADSAMNIATMALFSDFSEYSMRFFMPGKLTGTNGYIDSTKLLLWGVSSEYFLTRPYEMWAESKVPNVWAWIVSGVFILFVVAGIVMKSLRH